MIVVGRTFEDMLINLSEVIERFETANLKLKSRNCFLFAKEVEFLGHIVSADGIRTDPKKTERIGTWPELKCTRDVRSFLGLCSYYRVFVGDFCKISLYFASLSWQNHYTNKQRKLRSINGHQNGRLFFGV